MIPKFVRSFAVLVLALSWPLPSRADVIYTFLGEDVARRVATVTITFTEPPASGSHGWTSSGGSRPPDIASVLVAGARQSPGPFALAPGSIEGGAGSLDGSALDLGGIIGGYEVPIPGSNRGEGIQVFLDFSPLAGRDRVQLISRSFYQDFRSDFILTAAHAPAPAGVVLLGLGLLGVGMVQFLGWRRVG